MSARPLVVTVQNPDGLLVFIIVMIITAALLWLMLRGETKPAGKSSKRCQVCGGRVALTCRGALVHVGDAHLVARQLPHVAEYAKGGVL